MGVEDWGVDDFDTGGNLSCLGMSILLAYTVGAWLGIDTRVCLSDCDSAVAACRCKDSSWLVIDPVSSTINALMHEPAPPLAIPKKNDFVEVRCRKYASRYRLARVRRVHHTIGSV